MKKQDDNSEETKPDLKHDTMEFSAPTDGDDRLDLDDERREDDGISGEELDALGDDSEDDLAAALNAVETDRLADDDYIAEDESDEDDYYKDDSKIEG